MIESPRRDSIGSIGSTTSHKNLKSGNDENDDPRLSKRQKMVAKEAMLLHHEDRTECYSTASSGFSTLDGERQSESQSDCGTDTSSSVSALRGWLGDFGKQHKTHYEKNADIGKPPGGVKLSKPTRKPVSKPPAPQSAAASVLVKRLVVDRNGDLNRCTGRSMTPIRFHSTFKKEEVQATNNGYAPVAKLSAWLAADPTATKKVAVVRKGANVIAKSRKFEKDLQNVVVQKMDIQVGGVSDKKKWLQTAFGEEPDSVVVPPAFKNGKDNEISDDRDNNNESEMAYVDTFGDEDDEDENVEILPDTRETMSTISVTDKKKWLQNAFKKTEEAGRAKSDILPASNEQRDDAPTRAKQMWLQKSSSRKLIKENSRRVLEEKRSLQPTIKDIAMKNSQEHQRKPVKATSRELREDPRMTSTTRPPKQLKELPKAEKTIAIENRMAMEKCPPPKPNLENPPKQLKELRKADKTIALENGMALEKSLPPKTLLEKPPKQLKELPKSEKTTAMENEMALEKSLPPKTKLEKPPKQLKELPKAEKTIALENRIALERSPPPKTKLEKSPPPKMALQKSPLPKMASRRSPPPKMALEKSPTRNATGDAEEKSQLDFRAARQLLVQRSKANGNPVYVMNKVQRRKEKFEKLEKEMRQRAGPYGMLKPEQEKGAATDVGRAFPSRKAFEKRR